MHAVRTPGMPDDYAQSVSEDYALGVSENNPDWASLGNDACADT